MPDVTSIDLGHAFTLAPKEAVEYFRAKGFKITHDWRELWQDAHARAFTVSKMAKYDLLANTRKIIDRKLAEGLTLQDASKTMAAEMRKAGWWGKQIVVDAQGRAKVVQLGSMHRVRTIMRTNTLTAYSAGRYQRQKENAASRPYWRYTATQDASTRPSHAALDGKVWRHDDPIWETLYPPNGFNCRCRVTVLTADEVEKAGLKVIDNSDTTPVERQEVGEANPDTGEVTTWREGAEVTWRDGKGKHTFRPDPGWAYNPGKHKLPPPNPANAAAVAGQPTWKDYGRPPVQQLPRARAPAVIPQAASAAGAKQILFRELGLTGATRRRTIKTPVDDVIVEQSTATHMVGKLKDHRERHANRILPTLQDPDEIWMTYYNNGQFRKRYIKVWDDDRGSMSIATEQRDGSLLWNFMSRRNRALNNQRVGSLIYSKEQQG
ncbi:MAG: phage minor head protein [Halieaceae bacterium]|nr:phage minor head protein [Halieaceae bacterium]